ncbi:GNAT family N-acetyltransferase [Marinomonas epiphytica]
MSTRSKKQKYLEELDALSEEQKKAVSLSIDCLIENETSEEDIPLVITSYKDFDRREVLNAIENFCTFAYPKIDKNRFEPCMLKVSGQDGENACISLIKKLRKEGSTLLYWADSPSWISALPSGLFHVISMDFDKVYRGLNEQAASPIPADKEYTEDTLLMELFENLNHLMEGNSLHSGIADQKLMEECLIGLIRPIPAPRGETYNEKVTISSPDWQKLACVAIRRFQGKECDQGMSWDISDQAWKNIEAYTFTECMATLDGSGTRDCLIGLVTIANVSDQPYLSTAWIHPFYRGKGKMKQLWEQVTEEYGDDLYVEQPNTSMEAFLKSVGRLTN